MKSDAIRTFENLTSEIKTMEQAKAFKMGLTFEDRQRLEMRARTARAEMISDHIVGGILWVRAQFHRLGAWFKAGQRLRVAERQLMAMDDRMLADLGLSRGDVPFAVRRAAEGDAPQFDEVTGYVAPANQNLRRAA
jgi:uncharacterized protein YjiS (DUF1127 family)